MSARISLARPAQATGCYQPDPHGFGNPRSSNGYRAANPDDPLEKIRTFAHTLEENIDIYTQPLKPYLPAIGRFLIVITFLEDSLRILSQWSDQLWYLQKYVSSRHRCMRCNANACAPGIQAPPFYLGLLAYLPADKRSCKWPVTAPP